MFMNAHRCVNSVAFLRQFDVFNHSRYWTTLRGRSQTLKSFSGSPLGSNRGGCIGRRRTGSFRNPITCFSSAPGDSSTTVDQADGDSTNFIPTSNRSPRICILGGGFGGLYTAVKLEGLMWPNGMRPQVTLIDQSDRFVFKPLLYEVLEGTADEMEVAPYFRDLLAPFQTRFLQARVMGVEVSTNPNEGGVVSLEDGSTVPYDWLVIAIGAKTNFRGIPGVQDLAFPFCSLSDVNEISIALSEICEDDSKPKSQLVVVGAGYAGVELATALVMKIKSLNKTTSTTKSVSVSVVTDTTHILPMAPISQRTAAEQELSKNGITVKSGFFVESLKNSGGSQSGDRKYKPAVISLTPASNGKPGEKLEADMVLWTAGSSPAIVEQSFPFERTAIGCLKTEPSLRVVSQKRVFALGDDAVIDDSLTSETIRLPATAQVALQQADYVSWNLWASINNKPLLSFRYQHLGDMMALGTQNAAIALPVSLPKAVNDAIKESPLLPLVKFFGVDLGEGMDSKDQRPTIEGQLAALLRRAAYWYRQPTSGQRTRIVQSYLRKATQSTSSSTSNTTRN
eukprot:g1079.t1